ncbi:MAG: filamentous hemagglutinin N-terminal domain-containing protein [Cyanobacteria bacterium J06592_8]
MNQVIYSRIFALSSIVISTTIGWFTTSSTIAQIVPDNTLGSEGSVVTPNVNIRGINSDRIDGGAVRGGNLFHSFQEFNVEDGRGAYFSNPDNIINILTRVTGGNLSQILGTLGVLGNANLFLINPNGIVFGPNARLDVGGSFFATTADGILFENGVEFTASNPEAPPLLTINIPLGLNIRENPGTIVNQANLTTLEDGSLLRDNAGFLVPQGLNVPQNQTLALVGGDVIFDNAIAISPGSNIELGGLSEPGIVQLNSDGSLTFPTNIQRSNIALTNESLINIRADGGGNININAGNVEISGDSIIRAGIDQGLGSPEAQSGDVNINAQENILITGLESSIRNAIDTDGFGQTGNTNINANTITLREGGRIDSILFGQGNAGNINLITESLTMEQESSINSFIVGQGNGGVISIQANTIELSGLGTAIFGGSVSSGVGQGGELNITTGSLILKDNALIDTGTWGRGDGGDITINASESVILTNNSDIASGVGNSNNPDAVGDGGDITITARSLTLRSGSQIGSIVYAQGNTGKIVINTSEFLEVEGVGLREITDNQESTFRSEIGNSVSLVSLLFENTGNAGDIEVTTGNLILRGGGQISNVTSGLGNAGSIRIQASQIQLTDVFSETVIDGERFSIPQRSQIISTTSFGTGNAGDITITAERLTVKDGGNISTGSAGGGNAGNLTVQANQIEILGTTPDGLAPSQLDTSVFDFASELEDIELPIEPGTGNAGNITIEAERLVIRNGGQIRSQNLESQGNAGNILVRVNDLELVGTSVPTEEAEVSLWPSSLTTNSSIGEAGDVIIETERLVIRDGGRIVTATGGVEDSGDIFIRAKQITMDGTQAISPFFSGGLFSGTFAEGNGGNITIETENLSLSAGASIFAGTELDEDNNLSGSGRGGTIRIRATNAVDLAGVRLSPDRTGELPGTNISSSVTEGTSGVGGDVFIETERLTVRDGAEISALTSGEGNAGSVEIQAGTIELVGTARDGELPSRVSAEVTESAIGEGGTVDVNTQQLTVREGANITVSSQGEGNPGNLQVNVTDRLRLDTQGSLTAESATGQGGNIGIRSRDMRLRRQSEISATGSETGATQEGNITIDTNLLVLLEGSRILTDASNPTGGSNITIRPLNSSGLAILQSQDSLISAAGELSIDDTLNFDPPESLEVTVVDPAALIAQDPCRQRGESEFIITGRGGIAPDPTEELTIIEGFVEWESFLVEPVTPPVRRSSRRQQRTRKRDNNRENHPVDSRTIVPARGWIRNSDGEVILVGYDPTKTGVQRQPRQPIQCHSYNNP